MAGQTKSTIGNLFTGFQQCKRDRGIIQGTLLLLFIPKEIYFNVIIQWNWTIIIDYLLITVETPVTLPFDYLSVTHR